MIMTRPGQRRRHSGSHGSIGHGRLAEVPFPTVTAAFYHHAATCPDTLAVRDLSGSPRDLTYRALAEQVQQLASHLRDQGVEPGQRIPLVVKRGLEMVVGIWAILSCGAQYVPLDGGVVPDETITRVLNQAGGSIVLCLKATKHRITALQPSRQLVVIDEVAIRNPNTVQKGGLMDLATPERGCYVIYTSGTTGQPKGVDVTHKNVTNLVCLSPGSLGVRPGISVGQFLNISFDMAAWEIFACQCNGGTLVLRGPNWEPTLQEIDVLICTPTILSKYHPIQFPRIRTVATAGEPTTQALADLWASHGTYWNCCGPTETTIVNTMHKHVMGEELSIGRPTANNTVYILGHDERPVPVGVSGVMWAGGHGVSRGYVGLDTKTAEKYKPDQFANDGSKMYNTGDLGSWRPDGSIEILGRVDDQVKVKGFRVELDGVSASLASAPGVSRAAALLINGDIHGFTAPSSGEVAIITKHIQKRQPYYAVPAQIHFLDELPVTPNGKINKKELEALALKKTSNEDNRLDGHERTSDAGVRIELKSQTSMSTLSTLTEKCDLTQDIPGKQWAQPFRGLRHRVFIVYRTLFSLIGIMNLAALVSVIVFGPGSRWLGTITAINLTMAVLVRQDMVINALYSITCSVPKHLPLWIRSRCAKIYHLGGLHSGAGVCATTWLVTSTIRGTVCKGLFCDDQQSDSLATQVVSWLLCGLCCLLVGSAWPSFRKQHHDLFERFHRFAGWVSLALFWVRTMLSINDTRLEGQDFGLATARTPDFWLLMVATLSIASSWLSLRKVPVDAEVLSDHAVRLHFDYTIPVNGSFTRISRRPLLEWHSFATIPTPEATEHAKGYSLVVSNAGDWTRSCIQNPPTKLWVRGVPTCGVMRIATLFNRLVVIATGSGIGPLLGHINQQTCPTQLLWSTAHPEKTFGKEIVGAVREKIPDAIIHDTKLQGRPDLVRMGFNLAQSFGAEAVIIIANEKITKKVVYGLESRGIPAYGAIWDS
ncbi:Fc.00g053870.m01.CDS01 [Cosmosporella sp. VM-42]